jgi:NADH:ubiquinone oxidoreductase subunit 6 (subunit J)
VVPVAAFCILAAFALAGALGVVVARNVFYAAIGLVVSLIAVAGLYVTLDADFLAVAQFMIYVGGIAVLIVFAVMMTAQLRRGNQTNRLWPAGLAIAGLLYLSLVSGIMQTDWGIPGDAVPTSPMVASATDEGVRLPDVLFSTYLLPFELAGVVLLVATIGALVIARDESVPSS